MTRLPLLVPLASLALLALAPCSLAQTGSLAVAFEMDPEGPRVGQVVHFTDASSSGFGAATRLWDFGDGEGATGLAVSHAYADEGWFTVTLTVRNETAAREFPVTKAPVADFEVDPAQPEAGAPVVFIDRSFDKDDEIVAWTWDFGDGGGETDRLRPEHVYEAPGVYTVVLTVRDAAGHQAQAAHEVAVAQPTGDPPKPNGTGDPLFTDYESPSMPLALLAVALLAGAACLRRRP